MSRPFYKTIRFQLTLWYAVTFFAAGIMLLLVINIGVQKILFRDLVIENQEDPLVKQEITRINEVHKKDLKSIQNLFLWTLLPLLFTSTLGGWFLTKQALQPLEDITLAAKNLHIKDKFMDLPDINSEDEIGQLVLSLDQMQKRIYSSYQRQQDFIGDASHELKTPLSIMQTTIDSVLDDPQTLKKDLEDALNTTKTGIKEINNMLEELLLLSKDNPKLDHKNVDLKDIINQSLEKLKPMILQNKVDIEFSFDLTEKYIIKGNEILLQRAISNLIENSIKYSNQKNKTKLTVNINKINLRKSNYLPSAWNFNYLRTFEIILEINDNGIGISKKDLPHIFERFYRAESSRSRASGGSGLGLSIVKKVISDHKAEIKVKSEVNKGTNIQITFNDIIVN